MQCCACFVPVPQVLALVRNVPLELPGVLRVYLRVNNQVRHGSSVTQWYGMRSLRGGTAARLCQLAGACTMHRYCIRASVPLSAALPQRAFAARRWLAVPQATSYPGSLMSLDCLLAETGTAGLPSKAMVRTVLAVLAPFYVFAGAVIFWLGYNSINYFAMSL